MVTLYKGSHVSIGEAKSYTSSNTISLLTICTWYTLLNMIISRHILNTFWKGLGCLKYFVPSVESLERCILSFIKWIEWHIVLSEWCYFCLFPWIALHTMHWLQIMSMSIPYAWAGLIGQRWGSQRPLVQIFWHRLRPELSFLFYQ